MWLRRDIKSHAKRNLQNKYWTAFAVTLLVGILGGGSNIFTYQFNRSDFHLQNGQMPDQLESFFQWGIDFFNRPFPDFENWFNPFAVRFSAFLLIVALFGGLFALAYSIFVSPVIQVGGNRWFSRSRESAATPSVGLIFNLFKAGRYLKTVGSMLWMNMFLFLWGLIAWIPLLAGSTWLIVQLIGGRLEWPGYGIPEQYYSWIGPPEVAILVAMTLVLTLSALFALPVLIKHYSYRMTPWILADNPGIGYRRALKLSMRLTRGMKWELFVLDLSFIGWFLLGLMACGIGILFVVPYYQSAQAEAYAFLRKRGVDANECTMEELLFQPVIIPAEQPDGMTQQIQ